MTKTARAYERPAKHLRLEWEPAEEDGEPVIAAEAVAALFSFANSWLEPLATELRVGCYDPEIFTEGTALPPQPFHLLVREPMPSDVEIGPWYRSLESHVPSLTSASVQSWVNRARAQSCGENARLEISLRELGVRASSVLLPVGWEDDVLFLECYAGTVRIPIERRGGTAWIPAPPKRYGLDQPVTLSISNYDGWVAFDIDVYWSPWVEELDRPESPLTMAIARLAARGWHPSSD